MIFETWMHTHGVRDAGRGCDEDFFKWFGLAWLYGKNIRIHIKELEHERASINRFSTVDIIHGHE